MTSIDDVLKFSVMISSLLFSSLSSPSLKWTYTFSFSPSFLLLFNSFQFYFIVFCLCFFPSNCIYFLLFYSLPFSPVLISPYLSLHLSSCFFLSLLFSPFLFYSLPSSPVLLSLPFSSFVSLSLLFSPFLFFCLSFSSFLSHSLLFSSFLFSSHPFS